jgi:cytoskeletal protein CcmA (bactofilin family)
MGDILINGFGSSNGGAVHRVTINGKGTINGDVESQIFESNGKATLHGNLISEKTMVSGFAKINGNIGGNELRIDGIATISGKVNCEYFIVSGKAHIGSSVKVEEIKIQGKINVDGDCESETYLSEGNFHIDGLLSADKVDISLLGHCKAREVGGQTITVRKGASGLGLIVNTFLTNVFETELVEGDTIDLDFTKAKMVRGNDVTIGQDCEIERVEYRNTVHLHEMAKVKECIQV